MNESPLTRADLKDIEKAIYNCRLAEQELAKMDTCGMECTEQKLRCAHLMKFLETVQLQYPLKLQSPAAL